MHPLLTKQLVRLTEFLGKTLGPDYEIVLHDLTDKDNSVVAIANGHVSGRGLDAPLTANMLRDMSDHSYATKDYKINYSAVAVGSKLLRTSSMYIKDDAGNLVGMLSINFDDTRYHDISNSILKLCHPDAFVDTNFVYNPEKAVNENIPAPNDAENLHSSMSEMSEDLVLQVLAQKGVTASRLSQQEKLEIIEILKERGVFLLRGSVKLVARQLHCSQATIYRYLSKVGAVEKK